MDDDNKRVGVTEMSVIKCPHCGKKNNVSEEDAWGDVVCSSCFQAIRPSETKQCPYCGGVVKAAAVLCKHCRKSFDDSSDTEGNAIGKVRGGLTGDEAEIAEVLIESGLITENQLTQVLQKRQAGDRDLLAFLLKNQILTKGQVQSVEASKKDAFVRDGVRVGEIAVQKMMITEEQLSEALRIQQQSEQPIMLADVLVYQGMITEIQKVSLLAAQKPQAIRGESRVRYAVATTLRRPLDWFRGLQKKRKVVALLSAGGTVLVLTLLVLFLGGTAKIRQNCTMKGNGDATCTFTNQGTGSGSICGYLYAVCKSPTASAYSETICSGEVEPNETRTVSFSFVKFGGMVQNAILVNPYASWLDICSFSWRDKRK